MLSLFVLLVGSQAVLGSSLVDDAACDCFLINGSNPTYYAEHRFMDFRSLSEYAGIPDAITDPDMTASAPPTSDFFADDAWTSVWELQSWDNKVADGGFQGDGNVLMVNSLNNVYIQESGDDDTTADTFMTLRTKRLPKFQTAAEFESTTSDYQFLSLRMLARTVGSPGAVTAMFTYRDSAVLADVQEADIEILTSGPRDRIQYTNQPSYKAGGGEIPEAMTNASMPGSLRWTDWVVHRLDWTPERSIWYVDGTEVSNIEFQTPRDAAGLNFNAWSDGGNWSGRMPVYDEAYLQIQWMEMVYNTTSHAKRPQDRDECHVVCSIDETDKIGTASMLWESKATLVRATDGSSTRWAWGLAVGMTLILWIL